MKCWHCNTELIWGGDYDISEEDSEYCVETNLSCPQCDSFVMVYLPKDKMWKHVCPVEETEMEIGKSEECNWCGATEDCDWKDNESSS